MSSRRASMPASLHIVASSAHVKPPLQSSAAKDGSDTSGPSVIDAVCTFNTANRSAVAGSGTSTRASIRPGRTSACKAHHANTEP